MTAITGVKHAPNWRSKRDLPPRASFATFQPTRVGEEVSRGRDRPARPLASVKDVAAAAGVSLGTVSNVLNRPEVVSAGTRERVERAMAELGFVRNEFARQLRMGTSRTLAYVMLDATNPFFTDVAQGIEIAAEGADVSVVICNSNNRSDREQAHLAALMEQRVQGILLTPIDPAARVDRRRRRPRRTARDRRPDPRRRPRSARSPSTTSSAAGWPSSTWSTGATPGWRSSAARRRWARCATGYAGARQAWSDAGLPAEDLVELPTSALTVAEGRGAGERLAGLPVRRRPTAAFCANDITALGLLQHAIGAGWRVPGDLAIVGYDDIEFASAAAVPLTSVRQPREELGRTAAQLLLAEATDAAHLHQRVLFQPELVARASTLAGPVAQPTSSGYRSRSISRSDLPCVFGAQTAPTTSATSSEPSMIVPTNGTPWLASSVGKT